MSEKKEAKSVAKKAEGASAKKNGSKADLVAYVKDELNSPLKDARAAVNSVLAGMMQCVQEHAGLSLVNFVVFRVRRRKERMVTNFATKEPKKLEARNVVVFKPSLDFKNKVKEIKGIKA